MKNKFYWRSFVSFSLALSFIITTLSGVVLYLAPPGRIARWISWIMLGFKRGQWEDLHTLFSYLFVLFALLHLLIFNWRPFITYIRSKISGSLNRGREMLVALALCLVIFILTLMKIPPVYSVMDLGKNISSGWAKRKGTPPAPHSEEMTFKGFSRIMLGTEPGEVAARLTESGYTVSDPDKRFSEIAAENNLSPAGLYEQIAKYFTAVIYIPDKK